jgi:hypothetical protein
MKAHISKRRLVSFNVLAIFSLLLLASCSNPEKEFKKAETTGTQQAYEQFVQRFPDSQFSDLARQRIDDLAFASAKTATSSEALKSYLSRPGKPGHEAEAKPLMVTREFNEAIASNSVPLLRQLLATETNAPSAPEAREHLAIIIAQQIEKSGNTRTELESFTKEFSGTQAAVLAREHLANIIAQQIEKSGNNTTELESFTKEFAGTPAAVTAEKVLVKRAYDKAVSDNSVDAMRKFLDDNPNTEWSDEARHKLAALIEKRDWERALANNTIDSYRSYLGIHGDSSRLMQIPVIIHVENHTVSYVDINRYSNPPKRTLTAIYVEPPVQLTFVDANDASKRYTVSLDGKTAVALALGTFEHDLLKLNYTDTTGSVVRAPSPGTKSLEGSSSSNIVSIIPGNDARLEMKQRAGDRIIEVGY